MKMIRNCQTCMSSFFSLLLAATNLIAVSFLIVMSNNTVTGI